MQVEIDYLVELVSHSKLMQAADLFHSNQYAGYKETISFTTYEKVDKRFLVKLRKVLRQIYETDNTRFNKHKFVKFIEIRFINY